MRKITFFAPGSRHYDNGIYANKAGSFMNISITGSDCQCNCDHCGKQLLPHMTPAMEPRQLIEICNDFAKRGGRGVLISGGNDSEGSVPLQPFAQALQEVSAMGLTIVVHTGLLTQETAALLAHTGIHRVSMDLIGDRGTIREVCHLDRTPAHFRQSLQVARQYALPVSPHIVAGLHYGSIRGEYAALAMAAEEGVDSVVIVILTPRRHTPMAAAESPPPADVEQLFRVARKLLPHTPLSLGCARPPGEYARSIERMAVDAGFNSIAYPSRETLDYVTAMNYEVQYKEVCCAMVEI